MSSSVLDTSAVLAYLKDEQGAQFVFNNLVDASISSVNLAEVVTKLIEWGRDIRTIRQELALMGLESIDFTEEQAITVGALRASTRRFGLSLGDRACLALALELGIPALTADRRWSNITEFQGLIQQIR